MSNENLAADRAVSTAERIEELDSVHDLEPLDVKVSCSLYGSEPTVSEVVLVLGTGGPHVEFNATNGTVTVHWGSDTHTTHVNNEALCDDVHNHYSRIMEDNYLA